MKRRWAPPFSPKMVKEGTLTFLTRTGLLFVVTLDLMQSTIVLKIKFNVWICFSFQRGHRSVESKSIISTNMGKWESMSSQETGLAQVVQ